MTKFGKLIDTDLPILFGFYKKPYPKTDALGLVLDETSQYFEGRVKIYKIEATENPKLMHVLKIESFPSFVIYDKGEMVWRHKGEVTSSELIEALNPYL